MKRIFRSLLFSFFLTAFLHPPVSIAAPPEEWHHLKTNLTSLKSGWSSNRHYAQPEAGNSHQKTDGCGLVHFELPPIFSASSFDRHKIKIALSLTTYVSGDFIHPKTGLEISSINPQWSLTEGEQTTMTVQSGNYSKSFAMTAQKPATWIAPIDETELGRMLIAFANNSESQVNFSSGEAIRLKHGHIKSVLENFRACLAETHFANLPELQLNKHTHHFF